MLVEKGEGRGADIGAEHGGELPLKKEGTVEGKETRMGVFEREHGVACERMSIG
jgi:hypothetical protein